MRYQIVVNNYVSMLSFCYTSYVEYRLCLNQLLDTKSLIQLDVWISPIGETRQVDKIKIPRVLDL